MKGFKMVQIMKTNFWRAMAKKRWASVLLASGFVIVCLAVVEAGSVVDYGTLAGGPATARYVAWLSTSGTPPSQIMTEDSYNPGTGKNGGYQGGFWLIGVGNFNNPAASAGNTVNAIFGDGSNLYTTSFAWDTVSSSTNHGSVAVSSTGSCVGMSPGSQNGSGKTINWTDVGYASQYYIYRSQNPSGAGNDASNGRYNYVATIGSGVGTYLDATCSTGTSCWHVVVPVDGSGAINGCTSLETSPTSIDLQAVEASSVQGSGQFVIWVGLVGIMFVALSLIILRQREAR